MAATPHTPRPAHLGLELIDTRVEEASQASRRAEIQIELAALAVADDVHHTVGIPLDAGATVMRAMPVEMEEPDHTWVGPRRPPRLLE